MDMEGVGRFAISFAIIVGYFGFSYIVLKTGIAPEWKDFASQFNGGLQTLAAAVVTYWVGSSASSDKKNKTIERLSTGDGK